MEKNFKINLPQYLFSAIFGLSLYFLLYLPLEFFLTEISFVTPRINPWINTGILLFFLLVANLFDWERIINKRKKLIILLILVIIAFGFYGVYRKEKLAREYLPKIYQVKPFWAIQAQLAEIKGVNFGPVWKRGKVKVDGMEFLVKDWSETKILAEVPVPFKSGRVWIYVETTEGKTSNRFPLEIRNPDYLRQYLK